MENDKYQEIIAETDVVSTTTLAERTAQSENKIVYKPGYGISTQQIELAGGAVRNSHFKPMMKLGAITIYVSDGSTPASVLGGQPGDICFGADSGKAYKCTAGATWVSFT